MRRKPAGSHVGGLLLAAGCSLRYPAGSKLLLSFREDTVVGSAVRAALAAELRPLVVVIGHEAEAVREALGDAPVRFVENREYRLGLGTSLAAGIRELEAEREVGAVAILLGDEPGVRPAAIRSVVSAWRELGVPAARAVYRDRPGHPVIVDRSHFPRMARASGDEGLGALLRAGELPLHAVRIDAPAPLDIDTPDDYAAARRRRKP